jgi:hypothetical protein
MLVKPARLPGMLVGGVIVAACVVLGFMVLGRFLNDNVTFGTFGWGVALFALGALAVTTAFEMWSLWTLTYLVFEGKLLIRWGPQTRVVPVAQITRTVVGKDLGVPFRTQHWWWPGNYRFLGRIVGIGDTEFYTTSAAKGNILVLVTPYESFAISPPDIGRFQAAIDQERLAGFPADAETRYWWPARLPLWADRNIQILLLACLALTGVTLAIVLAEFPSLPELIAIQFNAFGQPTGVADRTEVFQLVVGAIIAMVITTGAGLAVHFRDRVAAYVSVCGGIGVQVLFLIAAIRIVT